MMNPDPLSRRIARILGTASALSVIAALLRSRLSADDAGAAAALLFGLKTSYQDHVVIWLSALAVVLMSFVAPRSRRMDLVLQRSMDCVAIAFVLLCAVNVLAVKLLGGSLTYQWLYYADLFRSFTPQSAVRSAVNVPFVLGAVGGLAAYVVLSRAIAVLALRLVSGQRRAAATLAAIGISLTSYVPLAAARSQQSGVPPGYLTNAAAELVRSTLQASPASLLQQAESDKQPFVRPMVSGAPSPWAHEPRPIKNVLIFVLESVGAEYVAGTGSEEARELTPRLAALAPWTVAFRAFYTHAPHSTKAMFSLITSRYPWLSFEPETTRYASQHFETIADRMRAAGMATGIFMSGDLQFQGVDAFIEKRGFDTMRDLRTIRCDAPRNTGSTAEWTNLDSVDDTCTAAALNNWIDEQRDRPYFAMLWTGNTHWPYFPTPGMKGDERISAGGDRHLHRYKRALQSSDAAIGIVVDHLKARGQWEETLLVVVGDHGDAFGQHGHRLHGNSVYEEEIRIPMLLVHAEFRGRVDDVTVGGMVDVAPTVLHLQGEEGTTGWQGFSLFAAQRPADVFFFAPNQDIVAGWREGPLKVTLTLTSGMCRVSNLSTDPGERIDLSVADTRTAANERLAGWAADQSGRFARN